MLSIKLVKSIIIRTKNTKFVYTPWLFLHKQEQCKYIQTFPRRYINNTKMLQKFFIFNIFHKIFNIKYIYNKKHT